MHVVFGPEGAPTGAANPAFVLGKHAGCSARVGIAFAPRASTADDAVLGVHIVPRLLGVVSSPRWGPFLVWMLAHHRALPT